MQNVSEFITKCLEYEQYAFSWPDLKEEIPKTDTALSNELLRLSKKNQILNLRKGFYLILPPRYRNYGKLPVELYADKLFRFLTKPYYIAFYSAAAHHGAGHQQIQKDYLITQIPNIRDIQKGVIHLDVAAISKWPEKNVQKAKSDAGYYNVSSPALTAADLIHFQSRVGGINRILAILEELSEAITQKDIDDLLSWYPHKSTIQRLGFLLDELYVDSKEKLLPSIRQYLKKQTIYPVLLSLEKDQKPGRANNPWKIDVNIELDSDL